MARKNDITLCLIARDEEAMLPACLASVQGAVDRTLLVDTGSRDRSREIGLAHGATVIQHAWKDDFASARNAALAHVPDGWILVLDADERLASGAARVLREEVERGGFECGLLPLSNASSLDATPKEVLSGAARRGEPVLLPRLLLRTPDLAWEGIVHENLDAWILRGKRHLRRVEAPIIHYGQVPELRAAREKDARNLRLLERRVASAPNDPAARTYLAREFERAGRAKEALAESGRAWEAVLAAQGRGLRVDAVAPSTLHVFLLLRQRQLEAARVVLDQAVRTDPAHPNLNLLRAALEESVALRERDARARSAALLRAEQALQACLACEGSLYWCELLPGATDWSAATRLGVIQLMQERPAEALASFEQALRLRPGHPEAEFGKLEAQILLTSPADALPALERHLSDRASDAWILSALACLRMGSTREALDFAREACRRLERHPPLSRHRTKLLGDLITLLAELTRAALPGENPVEPVRE